MRIYLVGSYSCGKTTLCRHISKQYNLHMIPEMARAVLARMEMPLEKLRYDIDLVNLFQTEVVKGQINVEKSIEGDFISDRAFDSLAFVAEHSTLLSKLMKDKEVLEYIEWVKGGTVFFVRPHKELMKADGVRETPNWESVVRIDGMIKVLLEQFEVPYLPIASLSMQERVRTIDFVIKPLLKGKE